MALDKAFQKVLDLLKLSGNPYYQQAAPEKAAKFAQIIRESYNDPEIRQLFKQAGVPVGNLLDGPVDTEGIMAQRGAFKSAEMGNRAMTFQALGIPASTGLYKTTTAGELSKGSADFLQSYGIGDGGGYSDPEATNFPDWMPLVSGAGVTRTLANMAGHLASTAGGLKTAAMATSKIPNLFLRGGLSHSLGFSGMEGARQVGRKIAEGEPFKPGQLAYEGIVGASAGIPAGRLAAAGLAGAAAGIASPLTGTGSPQQTLAEVLAAVAFGNPRIANRRSVASVKQIKQALGDAPDQAQTLQRAAADAATPVDAALLQERARLVKTIAGMHDRRLIQQILEAEKGNPPAAQTLADAAAQRGGMTRPVNAPAEVELTPKAGTMITDTDAAGTAALFSQEPMDFWRWMGNQQELVDEAARAGQIEEAMRLRTLTEQRFWKYHEAERAGRLPPPVNEYKLLQSISNEQVDIADIHAMGRLAAVDERLSQLREADAEILRLKSDRAPTKDIKAAQLRRNRIKGHINKAVKGEFEPIDEAGAARLMRNMLQASTTPREADNLYKNLPTNLQPYADQLQHIVEAHKKAMMTLAERTAFLAEIRRQVGKMEMYGAEIVDPAKDAVNAVATAVMSSGIQRGKLRAIGGVDNLLDDIVDKIDIPEIRKYVESLKTGPRKQFVAEVNKIMFGPRGSRKINLAGPKALPDLTRRAFAHGMRLTQDGNKYVVRAHGLSEDFSSLAEVNRFVDKLESPWTEWDDPMHLHTQAGGRLLTLRYLGDDEWRVHNMLTGEGETVQTMAQAAETISRTPPAPPTDLTPGSPVRKVGQTSRKASNAEDIRLDYAEGGETRLPSRWVRSFRELGKLTQDIETALPDLPAFTGFWQPLIKAKQLRDVFEKPFLDLLSKVHRGSRRRKRQGVWHTFISPTTAATTARKYKLSPSEVKSVAGLRDWFSSLGVDPDELVTFVQRVRSVDGDISRAKLAEELPQSLEFMRGSLDGGHTRLDSDNFLSIAQEVLRAKSNQHTVGPALERVAPIMKKAESLLHQNVHDTVNDRAFMLRVLQTIQDRVTGQHDQVAADFAKRINKHILPAFRKLGLTTENWSSSKVEKYADMAATMFSGTAMSLRPALVIRNFFQSMLPALKVGYGTNLKAIFHVAENPTQAFREAHTAGALGTDVQALHLFENFTNLDPGLIRRLQKGGLIPYRWMDKYNRAVSYHAGRIAMESNLKRFASGKGISSIIRPDEKFFYRTGLTGSSLTVQNQIAKLINNGQYDEAAQAYGRHISDETQYLYSREAAPMAFQGVVGRMFGQFGIWPMSYWEYITRNMGLSSAVGTGTTRLRARNLYRAGFAIRAVGMLSALELLENAMDIDTSSFNFANPLDFEGGPMIQVARDSLNLIGGGEYEKDQAGRNIMRAVGNFLIPFRSAGTDYMEASNAKDPTDKILLALGFNLTGERRERSR